MKEEKVLNYLTLISGVIILGILLFLAYYSQLSTTPVVVFCLLLMGLPLTFFGFLFICGIIRLLINLIFCLIRRSKKNESN